jgi:hypothetical protein
VPTQRSATALALASASALALRCVRSLDREDDLGADCAPDVIECPDELAVTVTDHKPDDGGLLIKRGQVAGLLGNPGAGGVGGDASEVDLAAAWRCRNDRHVVDVAARRGVGWRPLVRRTLAMELVETQKPRRSSSPRMRW